MLCCDLRNFIISGMIGSLDLVEKNTLMTCVSRLFSVCSMTIANLPDLSLTKVQEREMPITYLFYHKHTGAMSMLRRGEL